MEIHELENYGKYDENRLFKNFPSKPYTSNYFLNLLIENFIGREDWILSNREVREVLIKSALEEFNKEYNKFKKRNWIEKSYTISEMINGRNFGNAGKRNGLNKYSCPHCDINFSNKVAFNYHLFQNHKLESVMGTINIPTR